MPWKFRRLDLIERECDQLRSEIVRLKHDLSNKERFIGRLKFLCRERMTRIDDLNGKVDQLRHQNKLLESEAEHYADMIRIMPQLDPAMLSPK